MLPSLSRSLSKYPLPFVLVGIVYEWWWPNPLLRKLIKDRTDKYWSFILIVLVGGAAWLLYQLVVLLMPELKTLVYNSATHTSGDVLRIVFQGLLDAAIGFFLLLPIQFLMLKYCKKPQDLEISNNEVNEKGSTISVKQTRTNGTFTEETEFTINNVYLETERSGKIKIGVPGAGGTLAIEFGPIKTGDSVQLFASTADPSGVTKDIPISGSIQIPHSDSEQSIDSVTGSGISKHGWNYKYELNTGFGDEMKLYAGQEADNQERFRFYISSPPGTLQKIIKQSIHETDQSKEDTDH